MVGRVIKAMNSNWHPDCFRCQKCDVGLADIGFVKNAGRALCRPCHKEEKEKPSKHLCKKCQLVVAFLYALGWNCFKDAISGVYNVSILNLIFFLKHHLNVICFNFYCCNYLEAKLGLRSLIFKILFAI